MQNLIQLDMERTKFSDSGVSDYSWPHSTEHLRPFRDDLVSGLVAETRSVRKEGKQGSEGLSILLHHLFLEVLSLYYCVSVIQGYAAMGRQVAAPHRARVMSALSVGKNPPPPAIASILLEGPHRPSAWRLPMRIARDVVVTDKIVRRRLLGPDFGHEIIAATIYPLMEAHANHCGKRVTFRRPHIWFADRPRIKKADELKALVTRVCDIAADAFGRHGVPVPMGFRELFDSWLGHAIAQAEGWLKIVAHARVTLPRQLWVGSGGDIWTRILRHAVRNNGGEVTAHDHGSGTGQFIGEMHDNVIEFDFCDRFVTFTPEQAKGLRQHHLNPRFLMREDIPEIVGLPATVKGQALTKTPKARAPQRVMLISSYYYGDVIPYQAFISDIAYLDFEVRLLSHLRGWGYEIIYKPHPLITTRPPADFADNFGGREIDRPSEQVLSQADILILPDPSSTAFATSLASSVPAIFIDLGLFTHSETALKALKTRCAIVSAVCGPNQRVSIDWDNLRHALVVAPNPGDNTYFQLFHSHAG